MRHTDMTGQVREMAPGQLVLVESKSKRLKNETLKRYRIVKASTGEPVGDFLPKDVATWPLVKDWNEKTK